MATAGTLIYNTKLDTSGMEKGLRGMTGKVQGTGSTIKSILGGLGIAALVSKGIGAISSSMDGAVKRLDTMNNFPKVMSNLGISTEKSQKSIDKLSDKLQGLPTSIDAGAQSVQRLTSKNGDIEKSTDYFLAMNNAILAGGAPMQMQETAIEQLSQAYAKGKPDMMEWRSLMSAMPAQLKQVAGAMGYVDADALGEALRSGSVSMDDFMNTLVDLNKNGTGNFQSFEEQARNSTGGIQTAITNMKTAITRGVAGALDTLDKSLKDANLGGLSGVISSIGKAVESLIKKITPYIPPIINFLVSVFKWIKDNQEALKFLAIVIGTVVGTFMAIQKVIAIINAVKIAIATLNAVMLANPIGVVIAAVAGLIAIFVYLWKHSEGFRNFWIGLWEGIKNVVIGAWEFLKGLFTGVIEFVKNNWKQILLFLVNPFAGAFAFLYKHSTKFRNFINNVFTSIINFFKAIPGFIISIPEKIIAILQKIPYYIGFVIGWIIGKYLEFIKTIWNFITKDIPAFVSSVINWIKQLPTRIWAILTNVFNRVKTWGTNMSNRAKDTGKRFVNNVVNFIKSLPSKIWSFLVNAVTKVIEWRRNLIEKGKRAAKGLFDAIVNGIKNLPNKVKNIGKNIVTGIWNGIKGAKDWLVNNVKNFGKGIVGGLKKALKIGSPSKVFRDEVGKWIPAGVAVGIDANTDSALKSIDDMSNEMIRKMQSAVNLETGRMVANANIKGNSFLNNTTVNSHVVADVYMDRTKVGQAVTPIVAQTIRKAGA